MNLRIEVQEDCLIEVMRSSSRMERNVFHKGLDLNTAMILIRYWLGRDLEKAQKDRFVSQATKEARKAFKQLESRSPYHEKPDR